MKPDKTSTTPLYIQIREDIRRDITSGRLSPGDRLPPVTSLAADRDVTAATIRRALQDLIDEGLVTSHVGRGTFIADGSQNEARDQVHAAEGSDQLSAFPSAGSGTRRLRQSVSRSLNDMMSLAQKPGVIAFTRGISDPGTVESGILTKLAQEALADGEEMFRECGDPRGLPSLRKAIAALYRRQDLDVSPDQILVTSGSQQAVALLAQQAAENGTSVICETPCYTGVTNAFSAFGLPVETVIRDEDGPDLSQLPARTRADGSLLYLCPVLHNPMGTDISPARRDEVALWARENGATLVSDEVFRDLHFNETPVPLSFLKDPGPERTVILGSLSKSFISGLRVGWLVTSEERVRSLTGIKKAMDLGCPPLMQGIARAFLENENGLAAHRLRITGHYRILRDITLAALGRYMPEGVTWTRPQGGFQLWVTLPEEYSCVELFLRAVEKGAAFLPGPLQDIDNRFHRSFRLCYGSLSAEEIETGIRRLAGATREYLAGNPGGTAYPGHGDF